MRIRHKEQEKEREKTQGEKRHVQTTTHRHTTHNTHSHAYRVRGVFSTGNTKPYIMLPSKVYAIFFIFMPDDPYSEFLISVLKWSQILLKPTYVIV